MAKMIVLVGNIGSGKTTYCKHLIKEGSLIVSRDALRYMIGNGKYIFDKRIEPAIFESERNILENLMLREFNVAVDETGINKRLRRPYIRLAKNYEYEIEAHVMPILSKKVCVDRRMKQPHCINERDVWEAVWEKFNNIYEPPTRVEGFDKIKEVLNGT
jgi:predicted kinase